MIKKVLVVGSGPSAFGSLLSLNKNRNLDVTLIDNSNLDDFEHEQRSCIFNTKFLKGTRVSLEANVYQPNEYFNNSEINSSKAFGGFSNVWGGTFSSIDEKSLKAWNDLNIDIKKYLEEIKLIIPKKTYKSGTEIDISDVPSENIKRLIKTINSEEYPNTLAEHSSIAINNFVKNEFLNKENCNNCGQPRWTCNLNTIWSSKYEIKKFINEKKINYLESTKLISLKETDNKVICNLEEKNQNKTYEFDKVFIGAGVLNTSTIMINSGIVDQALIKISEMINLPIFMLFKNKVKLDSFSDLFIQHSFNKKTYFMQFYFYSKTLAKFAESSFSFSKLLKIIPDWIMRFTGGIFIYFDQDLSNYVKVSKNDKNRIQINKVENQNIAEIKKGINNIYRIFFKLRMFPIGILKTKYFFGKSYHYGAQFPHSKNPSKNESDIFGRIENLKNAHIIDSSVLPIVNVGSITPTIIANSYRITELSLNN